MLDSGRRPAIAVETERRVFLRGLELDASIGCYPHELEAPQPVRIDLALDVEPVADPLSDSLDDAVCYDRMAAAIREIVAEGHIRLVETLAERIAAHALAHPMVRAVDVRIEKPRAVAGAAAAGVEIRRRKA